MNLLIESMGTRVFCAVLLLSSICTPANAVDEIPTDPRFDHISRSDGLSNASVSGIVQDRHGFIWFGTQGGLNRYDGRGVEVWEHDPFDSNSLPHNLIQTLYLDPEQPVLWIGTYRGLSRFDIETQTFTNYAHAESDSSSLSDDVVTAVVRDEDGYIWIGTLDGLNRLDPRTEEILRVGNRPSEEDGLPNQTVRALHIDDAGRLWVGTYGGLALVDREARKTLRVVGPDDGLPGPYVMSIHQNQPGSLWLGVWDGGVVHYEIDSGRVTTIVLADNRLYVLGGEDRIYAGTWGGGLFELDPQTEAVTRYTHDGESEYGLSHNVIYSLLIDDADVLWIGTNGNGVNRLSGNKRNHVRFRHEPRDDGSLSAGKVTAIRRDSAGVLWIGTYTGGLNRWDPEADRMVHYRHDADDPHSLTDDIVTSIFEDSRGDLWITTNGGLNRYDRARDRFDRFYHDEDSVDTIPDDITYCMAEDSQGNLWIGTYSAGVSKYDRETGRFTHYPHDADDPTSLSDDLVYTMLFDSDERLWIGTNNGLNRYDPAFDGFVRYLHDSSDRSTLSSNTVRVLHEGSEGALWIGTVSGGLNRFEPQTERFSHVTKRDGIPDNTVVGILPDSESRLWLATLYGLSVVDKEMNVVRNLDEQDGLAGMEFNNGHFRDTDGTLMFGGPHGVSVFDDELLSRNTYKPPVHIRSVTAKGVTIENHGSGAGRIELPYDQASFSAEFVALDYEAPMKNRYKFKLIGFDEEWTESGNRNYTTYTNLPAGHYTFVVQGANNDGVWGREPATLEVSVEAPPWVRWWAFLAYFVFAAGVYAVAVRIREGRLLKARVHELTETRERLQAANRRLEELSKKDALTGLFNRRYLDARLVEELARARHSGAPLSILVVDVDRFKAYNDRYGHEAGDESLKVVAQTLEQEVNRASDFVTRYGGEEFCIVLPQTDGTGALAVAHRVNSAVRRRSIAHESSDVDEYLTVSVGACTWTVANGRPLEGLVSAADAALYRAKQSGRNAVEACEDAESA